MARPVATILGVPPTQVHEVVTFYEMFHQEPEGQFHLELCTNISCHLLGGDACIDHLKQKLGIEVGHHTPDGVFSLMEAECLASCLGVEAVPFEEMKERLRAADVVISATAAPHYILLREDIEKAMQGRDNKLLIIDIANPRDVDEAAGEVPGVELHNIDSLKNISNENIMQRMEQAKRVEEIIAEEMGLLLAKYKRKQAEDLLARLYSQAQEIKDQEVRRAMNKLSARHTLGEIEQKVLQDMSHSIVNKLFSEPTKALKRAAEEDDAAILKAACDLFHLEEDL